MKTFRSAIVFLFLTLFLTATTLAQLPSVKPPAEQQRQGGGAGRGRRTRSNPREAEKLTEMFSAMQKAWNAGDAAAYVAAMTDDAEFITPLGTVLSGKEAVRKHHRELFRTSFKGSHQEFRVRNVRFVRPRVAICDLEVTVTRFQSLPPGLTAKKGEPLRLRTMYVLTRDAGWVIAGGQSTEMLEVAKK